MSTDLPRGELHAEAVSAPARPVGGPLPPLGRVLGEVDVRLLGPLEVAHPAGHVIGLSGQRQRALLALLAMEMPRAVPTDRILESLWGESGPPNPEPALQVAVSRLRKAIGRELVETVPGGYRLQIPTSNLDVERFRRGVLRGRQLLTLGHPAKATESLRQALAQWRGEVLLDLRSFEFAEQAARVLGEERLTAVELLMEAELSAGNHELVVGELGGLVEAFPLREKLWGLLMLALYRSGRQAEALRAYTRVRDLLGDELGIEPSTELRQLEERILLHDPVLADLSGDELGDEAWFADPEMINAAPGEVIVEEGSPADAVYWIEDGEVEVVRSDPDGSERVLTRLRSGHYFGELASLLGTGRTATVRARTATTLSVHVADSFRHRLGVERAKGPGNESGVDTVRELITRGEYLGAYDAAAGLIERGDGSREVRYLAVLALARSGATTQARRRYQSYGLGSVDPGSVSPRLAEDIAALGPRLDKDMALSSDGSDRVPWAARSASGYGEAFDLLGSPYLGVNAATMWLVAEDLEQARARAGEALAALDQTGDGSSAEESYWHAVTEAEAALILGETGRAGEALAQAGQTSSGDPASRATTLRQLRLVGSILDLDPSIFDAISNPPVIHFCGHRIAAPGADGRFPADEQRRVAAELAAVLDRLGAGTGFGSLAAGADILAAEGLLQRGAELQVVLPFDRNEFVRSSVAPAGDEWVKRFDACLAQATRVVTATTGEYLEDPTLFDYCSRIAMGDALMRASFLQTEAHQVAIWDGVETGDPAGTAVDVNHWRATGHPSTVIPVRGSTPSSHAPSQARRKIRALVFADFAGFSKLTDAQVLLFQDRVMSALARTIEGYEPHLLSGRTWGDGLHLVFDDVAPAAECALALQATIGDIDIAAAGLAPLHGIRVAAHATPVFDGWDPISGSRLFYGAGVTQTARIEPRTPEGEVYVTHPFAALALLAGKASFECQYVGTLATSKGYGPLPLFALRRSRPD